MGNTHVSGGRIELGISALVKALQVTLGAYIGNGRGSTAVVRGGNGGGKHD